MRKIEQKYDGISDTISFNTVVHLLYSNILMKEIHNYEMDSEIVDDLVQKALKYDKQNLDHKMHFKWLECILYYKGEQEY